MFTVSIISLRSIRNTAMKQTVSIARSGNRFGESNKSDDISVSVSVRFLGWTSVENLIPHPPRFHLSSKPGFCIPLTLNSTEMYWYKGILCFCPAFKVYNHFPWHETTLLWGLKGGGMFVPEIAKWRQAVSGCRSRFSSDSSWSHKRVRQNTLLIEVTLPSSPPPPPPHILIGVRLFFCPVVSPLVSSLPSFPLRLLFFASWSSPLFYPNWITIWLKYWSQKN